MRVSDRAAVPNPIKIMIEDNLQREGSQKVSYRLKENQVLGSLSISI